MPRHNEVWRAAIARRRKTKDGNIHLLKAMTQEERQRVFVKVVRFYKNQMVILMLKGPHLITNKELSFLNVCGKGLEYFLKWEKTGKVEYISTKGYTRKRKDADVSQET